MANFNKKISETSVRLGEVRFCYANVFKPRLDEEGNPDKYSVQVLVPKADFDSLNQVFIIKSFDIVP